MKWTPNIPEGKDLLLIRASNSAGIACIIFGVLGAGFLVVLKQLYGPRILLPGVIGLIAGVLFTLSFLVDTYFAPPALVALFAGLWAILEEEKQKGNKNANNSGGTEPKV